MTEINEIVDIALNHSNHYYVYPKSPDALKIYNEYGFLPSKKSSAIKYLEQMLSKTSLTTKKATHENIQQIGWQIHDFELSQHARQKEISVQDAIAKTINVMEQKQEMLLKQAWHEAALEKETALTKQKSYYEELARRTKSGRDNLEEERIEKLIKKKEEEKKQALKKQWEEAEKLKQEAITRVLAEQHQRLRANAALEREKAIAASLRVAKGRFSDKLQKTVEATKVECQIISERILQDKTNLHQAEVRKLHERIACLTKESDKRLSKQLDAQRDYISMESDYSRFLNLALPPTSDFLLLSRKFDHGVDRSRCEKSSQTDLTAFNRRSVAVDTNLRILARR